MNESPTRKEAGRGIKQERVGIREKDRENPPAVEERGRSVTLLQLYMCYIWREDKKI